MAEVFSLLLFCCACDLLFHLHGILLLESCKKPQLWKRGANEEEAGKENE